MPFKLEGNNFRPKASYLPFKPIGRIEYADFSMVFDFAYDMVFGTGHHRTHRSGGAQNRNPVLKFKDVFEGKIGEFSIYRHLLKNNIDIGQPDLSVSSKGVWDSGDFSYKDLNISVRTSKHFAQMLLLECRDYIIIDNSVIYRPDKEKYDIILLTRVKTNILDNITLKCIENYTEDFKKQLFNQHFIYFDIPGYINNRDLLNFIQHDFYISKGSLLNGKTKMDANNYYVFAKDMKSISNLINKFLTY